MAPLPIGIDFIADPIRQKLVARKNKPGSSCINIDCPMCTSRGHPHGDNRQRCGVFLNNSIGVNCFNCKFSTRFEAGKPIGLKMLDFMVALGIPDDEVQKLRLLAVDIANNVEQVVANGVPRSEATYFDVTRYELPENAKSLQEWARLGCEDEDFLAVCEYLISRGDYFYKNLTYFWTPTSGDNNLRNRLIIPFYHRGKIVGWSGRSVVQKYSPKYWNCFQPGMLFNTNAITNPDRKLLVLVEGLFDAQALDCVASSGNTINDEQISWLKSSGKQVIVLPDKDKAGYNMVEIALKNDFAVSFPRLKDGGGSKESWWDNDIKDAADAVARYGQVYTLRSVIESATTNKSTILQVQKKFA